MQITSPKNFPRITSNHKRPKRVAPSQLFAGPRNWNYITPGDSCCPATAVLPCYRHAAMLPPRCHATTTLPCYRHAAMLPPRCHATTTLPYYRRAAMLPPRCHTTAALPCYRRAAMQKSGGVAFAMSPDYSPIQNARFLQRSKAAPAYSIPMMTMPTAATAMMRYCLKESFSLSTIRAHSKEAMQ